MAKEPSTVLKLGGIIMYPSVFQPNTTYKPKWIVDLLLDKDTLKIAKEHKLRIKKSSVDKKTQEVKTKYANLHEGYDGSYISIERGTHKADGTAVDPPDVIDAHLRPVKSDVNVGSGTLAKVRFLVRDQNPEALEEYGGYGCYLLGVQIINLVEFKPRREIDPEVDFVEEGEPLDGKTEFSYEKGDELPWDTNK